MKVIDNFLNDDILDTITLFIDESIKSNGWIDSTSFYNHELKSSLPTGYTPFLFPVEGEVKSLLMDYLKEQDILLKEPEISICLLQCGLPGSNVDWHSDTHTKYEDPDASDDFVVSGVSLYMNKDWNPDWGGLFLYKSSKNDTDGKFVEPKYNRCVINNGVVPHAVSNISPQADKRISIQMFISTDAISKEYVNVP